MARGGCELAVIHPIKFQLCLIRKLSFAKFNMILLASVLFGSIAVSMETSFFWIILEICISQSDATGWLLSHYRRNSCRIECLEMQVIKGVARGQGGGIPHHRNRKKCCRKLGLFQKALFLVKKFRKIKLKIKLKIKIKIK